MDIKNIKGMKYPDIYLIRTFFKLGLHKKPGRVLELGCGSGNNLSLFKSYGWDVFGVDYSDEQIKYANHNLECLDDDHIIQYDLSKGLPPSLSGKFDFILCANVLYYINRQSMIDVLGELKKFITPKCVLFISGRTPDDWRFGKGDNVEHNGFIIDRHETGEYGLLNIFYNPNEMKNLVSQYIGKLNNIVILNTTYENIENGELINNHDFILYGTF
jgi:SAM-dependent methyltransferase